MRIIFKINTSGKNILCRSSAVWLVLFIPLLSIAQSRNYSLIYSDNIKGSATMFGNTLLQIVNKDTVNTVKMNDNGANGNSVYGNDNENMQNINIDGNAGIETRIKNSSSADLNLPVGNNVIKLARLYWGGRVRNSDFDLSADSNKTIKIRKGNTGLYYNVAALGMDKITIVSGYTQYQAYADITGMVQNNGGGTYEVGNAPLSTGAIDNGGNNGGWSIVVVYENAEASYNSVRIYDGFEQVYNNGNQLSSTVVLSGLDVPSGTLSTTDAKMGALVWEGDANLNGDYLKINSNVVSNNTNPPDNIWNGTITNGGLNAVSKNPNYTNQMGLDIDQFDVGMGYGILPNSNSVTLEFGTNADKYYPGLFTFIIKMKDPTISIDNLVSDANNNHLGEANEILTYTLTGKNSGAGDANAIVISDTLPTTVTYLPNSLTILSAPGLSPGMQTDIPGDDQAEYIENSGIKTVRFRIGKNASAAAGGSMSSNESYVVQFKVTVNDPGTGKHVPSIMNIARIVAESEANETFVDDGTSIINPDFGPLPITMDSFNGILMQGGKVKLDWSTSMEINCKGYIVERSFDGNLFLEIDSVAGNGTTSKIHFYSAFDDVSAVIGEEVYYRIKQFDVDGNTSYSKIIRVQIANENSRVIISPNPFKNNLNISVSWNKIENMKIRIVNVLGREVFSKNVVTNKGLNYIGLDALSKLAAGNYFVQFISGSQTIAREITKQ